MNVLALVSDAFGGSGGIARYNRDLLTALVRCRDGNRVVALPRQAGADRSDHPAGIRQFEPPGSKLRYAFTAFRLAVTQGPFDAVFCGHLHLAPLAASVAGLAGASLWLQLHGWEAWEPPQRMQAWAADRAALITAVSRYTRRRFLACNPVDPRRVRVLPNTVGAAFSPAAKSGILLDRYGMRHKKVLLTVGRLAADERRKGHDSVIRALCRLVKIRPDLIYLIVGDGDDRPRLEDLSRQMGVADQVVFAGVVAADELADHYRLADVFVMPSTQEGFGIVFLEAAACGLRSIGGNRDGSTDALADGAIGVIVDPANLDELGQAIDRALVGAGPDPAEVRRYNFDNFAKLVCELTRVHLRHPKVPVGV